MVASRRHTTVIVIDVPYYCLFEEVRLIEGRLLFSRTDSAVITPLKGINKVALKTGLPCIPTI